MPAFLYWTIAVKNLEITGTWNGKRSWGKCSVIIYRSFDHFLCCSEAKGGKFCYFLEYKFIFIMEVHAYISIEMINIYYFF